MVKTAGSPELLIPTKSVCMSGSGVKTIVLTAEFGCFRHNQRQKQKVIVRRREII